MGRGNISCSGNLSSEWEGCSLRAVEVLFSRQDLRVGGNRRENPGLRYLIAARLPELWRGAHPALDPDVSLPVMETLPSFPSSSTEAGHMCSNGIAAAFENEERQDLWGYIDLGSNTSTSFPRMCDLGPLA